MKRKILLIENQKRQFDHIKNGLSNFEVFPYETEYISIIDLVRIWVNDGYTNFDAPVVDNDVLKYRDFAIEKLKSYIQEKKIEFIIMDYILGPDHCKTGIDLATEISQDANLKDKPILFFSKMEENNKTRLKDWSNLKNSCDKFTDKNWLPKGYSNLDLFFENTGDKRNSYLDILVERVDLLIKEPKLEKVISRLETSKEHFSTTELYLDKCDHLKRLIQNKSDRHDGLLDEILNKNDINYGDIERWIVQVKD